MTVRAIFRNKDGVLLTDIFVRAHIDEGSNYNALIVPPIRVTYGHKGHADGACGWSGQHGLDGQLDYIGYLRQKLVRRYLHEGR